MNLCFSKKSPKMKKYSTNSKSESWSPTMTKKYYVRRYHDGEEYTRSGDEYRPRESEGKRVELENGYRRNRNDLHAEKRTESLSCGANRGSRSSYGVDMEDKNSISNVLVHREEHSKAAQNFRSSMLWKDFDPNKLPTRNEVLPTFPPNRYSTGPDMIAQICPTPVAPRKKPQFRVNLDVSHYAPNEVIVKIEERFLIAEGKHFSESDFGYETCEFYRKYPLPEGLDRTDVSYKINNDGILIVTGDSTGGDQEVKENRAFREESKVDNSKKYAKRYSSYDNVCEEEPVIYAEVNKGKTKVAFGDFKLIDDKRYVLAVEVDEYSADDMKVKVTGNEVIVQGVKKIELKEGNEKRIMHKEFTKKFTIPSNADIETISSRMTSEGQLKIECSKIGTN